MTNDATVYAWASRYWPDLPETWEECKDYYYREFAKELRRKEREEINKPGTSGDGRAQAG